MVFSLFEYFDSVNCNDKMFKFGNFLSKNAITFDLTDIEKKTRNLVGLKFCCASIAAIKNVKIARKKINFFSKNIFYKISIFLKSTDF